MIPVKVFTFNLRVCAKVDGINDFFNRTGRVLEVLERYTPDLIGFQEVNDKMREWLVSAIEPLGYTVVGCGRLADYRGESTVAAYRTDKFMLVSYATKWLSATPDIPASRYPSDQSGCPRTYTELCLFPRGGSKPFLFINTHLDHQGAAARLLGAVQLVQRVSQTAMEVVITGDMNAYPDSPEIAAFTADGRLADATAAVGGTFHAFGKRTVPSKIDYIFTDAECDPALSHIIEDIPVDGVYISDHYPVCSYIYLR